MRLRTKVWRGDCGVPCVAPWNIDALRKGCVKLRVVSWGVVAFTPHRQVRWPPFLDMAHLLQMLASQQHVLNFCARVYVSCATARPRYQAHRVPEYVGPFVPATTSSWSQHFRGKCVCTSAYDTALFCRTGGIACASAVLPESAVASWTLPWLRFKPKRLLRFFLLCEIFFEPSVHQRGLSFMHFLIALVKVLQCHQTKAQHRVMQGTYMC